MIIRQSTAITVALGPFVDSTDGNTVEGALTITQPDIRLSKNGAAFAQKSAAQTLTHMENGYYSLSLSTTDTNTVGSLLVHCHETGALPVWRLFQVVEEAVYDALYEANATGLLPTNVTQFGGTNLTATAGRPEVNVTHAAGTAWGSGAITAASIATGALAFAKFGTGAIQTMVWDNAQTTALNTEGSAGKLLVDNLNATISSRATPAQVNAEVLDVLTVDTFAQPGQEAPAATTTLHSMIRYLYKLMRNKVTQNGTQTSIYDDAGTTIDHKATTSEADGVVTRDKLGSGA